MSMSVSIKTNGDLTYKDVCMGHPQGVDTITVDVSTLTTDFVDTYGWLKPGTPLQANGTPVSAGSQAIYGVVPNATTLRNRNDNSNLGADVNDTMVQVVTSGSVQKKAIEFNLGRALSANELAAFAAAGCKIALVL